MINPVENIRREIRELVRSSIKKAAEAGAIPGLDIEEIGVEAPREKEHGDFSTNVALQAAKQAKRSPRQVAETLISFMDLSGGNVEKVECAGPGFINFRLGRAWLYEALRLIRAEKEEYGRLDLGKGKRVMVEFVSANPTGSLHMGNARGGALGDCLASVLQAAGYAVTREYYINDAGNQIEKFGISLEARYIQLLKGETAAEFPEDGYHGEDIIEHVKAYAALNGDRLLDVPAEERRRALVDYALPMNVEAIKKGLEEYGIKYDVWFSEQSLYDSGEIQETLEYLKKSGYTYEKEGAVWFRASEFGAEKDEVIVRVSGVPTYFASDIAYHRNKFLKRGFDWVINLLGADHHGHVARMKSAVKALGIEPDRLDIVLFQLVRLFRNGEVARMSKRTGRAISLTDLLEEVGRDAARFLFNTKASGNHLDFDMDLAVSQSNENPVFYVQYAHARICSMLRVLDAEGIEAPETERAALELLKEREELELIKKLAEYPDEIRIAAQTLEPSRLTRYVLDVAALFHSFYNACRVKGEEEELMKARMVLVECSRTVIKNVLDLLSINAPERM